MFRFEFLEDYAKVLSRGPWFILDHFLTLRKWEPFFRPSTAKFSSIAIWIRFPKLPVEFYNSYVLPQLAAKIGTVLKVDSHTLLGDKGRYARVCVQIDLDKPLIKTIHIGDFKQSVLYESINKVCFTCGRIGHQKWNCPYTSAASSIIHKQNASSQIQELNANSIIALSTKIVGKEPVVSESLRDIEDQGDQYRPWILAERKKNKNSYKKGQANKTMGLGKKGPAIQTGQSD